MLKVPAISNLISLPFAAAAFALSHTPLVLICLFLYVCFGTMYLAPSISATYRLVAPRERALATAVLFLVLNFIGIGVGPLLTGFISHTIGNNLREAGMPAAQASADGLRYALCIIVFTFAWSTFHYYRAMRTLRQEELRA
jgi:MFS family permease